MNFTGVVSDFSNTVEELNSSPMDTFVQYLSAAMINLTISVQNAENASFILKVLIAWR